MPTSTDNDLLLYTKAEVAARFRVVPRTVQSWLDEGRFRYVRIGRTTRIFAADVDQALDPTRAAS